MADCRYLLCLARLPVKDQMIILNIRETATWCIILFSRVQVSQGWGEMIFFPTENNDNIISNYAT